MSTNHPLTRLDVLIAVEGATPEAAAELRAVAAAIGTPAVLVYIATRDDELLAFATEVLA